MSTLSVRRPRGLRFGNPVLAYELVRPARLVRRWGRYGLAAAILVGLLCLGGLLTAIVLSCSDGSKPDDDLFIVISIGLLFAACGLAPGVAAVSIAGEKRRGSWDLLLLTRLRPREIVLGKLCSRTLIASLPLLLATPFLIALAVLAEVEPQVVVATALVLPTTLLGFSALGLLCSARARSVNTAVALAYVVTAILILGVPLLEGLVLDFGDPILTCLTCPFASWAAYADFRPHNSLSAGLLGPQCYLLFTAWVVWRLSHNFHDLLGAEPGADLED